MSSSIYIVFFLWAYAAIVIGAPSISDLQELHRPGRIVNGEPVPEGNIHMHIQII